MMLRALGTIATFIALALPAGAMVGGAQMAEQSIARHVVLILGAHSLCTGVAIAPDLVLTAAHCVLENGKYRLVVFEGRRPSGAAGAVADRLRGSCGGMKNPRPVMRCEEGAGVARLRAEQARAAAGACAARGRA